MCKCSIGLYRKYQKYRKKSWFFRYFRKYHDIFQHCEQVERIKSTTSGSAPPTFRPAPPGVAFTQFASLSSDDVAAVIARLPDKSSAADPFPVQVLKDVSDMLTPFLMHLFNRSLAPGCVYCFFQGLVCDADPEEVGSGLWGQSVVVQADIELVGHF